MRAANLFFVFSMFWILCLLPNGAIGETLPEGAVSPLREPKTQSLQQLNVHQVTLSSGVRSEAEGGRWLDVTLKVAGAIATVSAAIFAAFSARGSVDAAKEMRESRRLSNIPRLSYRVLDRDLVITRDKRDHRILFVTTTEEGENIEEGASSAPRIEFINFSAPALNVGIEFSFIPQGEDDLSYLRRFLGIKDEERLELNDFGILGPKYILAARPTGDYFIPHIGIGASHTLKLPFAMSARYAISVINTSEAAVENRWKDLRDFPKIILKLSFDSIDGDKYEQIFEFRYIMHSYQTLPSSLIHLFVEELPSGQAKLALGK